MSAVLCSCDVQEVETRKYLRHCSRRKTWEHFFHSRQLKTMRKQLTGANMHWNYTTREMWWVPHSDSLVTEQFLTWPTWTRLVHTGMGREGWKHQLTLRFCALQHYETDNSHPHHPIRHSLSFTCRFNPWLWNSSQMMLVGVEWTWFNRKFNWNEPSRMPLLTSRRV